MCFNYHTHITLCDGLSTAEEYAVKAVELGFKALGFSSHAPLPFQNDWTLKPDKLDEYYRTIRQVKDRFKEKLQIYTGLEVDYIPGIISPSRYHVVPGTLDYLIGSVHMLEDPETSVHYSVDGPDSEFRHLLDSVFDGDIQAMVTQYYENVLKLINMGGYQILGHFDLIKKKNRGERYFSETEFWYKRLVERCLNELACTKIILEINTGGVSRGATDEVYPSRWILEASLNRKIPITINSDAHSVNHLDFYFKEVRSTLRSCGCSSIHVLLDGIWKTVGIDG